jgi:hypothetical protein
VSCRGGKRTTLDLSHMAKRAEEKRGKGVRSLGWESCFYSLLFTFPGQPGRQPNAGNSSMG